MIHRRGYFAGSKRLLEETRGHQGVRLSLCAFAGIVIILSVSPGQGNFHQSRHSLSPISQPHRHELCIQLTSDNPVHTSHVFTRSIRVTSSSLDDMAARQATQYPDVHSYQYEAQQDAATDRRTIEFKAVEAHKLLTSS